MIERNAVFVEYCNQGCERTISKGRVLVIVLSDHANISRHNAAIDFYDAHYLDFLAVNNTTILRSRNLREVYRKAYRHERAASSN